MSIQLTFDEKCCSIFEFWVESSRHTNWPVASNLTNGSIISSPRVFKSNSHYYSYSWNYHINIVGRHINLFSDCMYLFFSLNYPTPEFKNDKLKHKNTVNSTSQIGRHWSNVTPRSFWPMSRNQSISYHQKYLKMHFMPETFISIDNNLQRMVRLHNIDRLSHDTVFWNLHFYMPNVISEEIHVFSMWYQCLYYPYLLPQHMTFSDLQPKLK